MMYFLAQRKVGCQEVFSVSFSEDLTTIERLDRAHVVRPSGQLRRVMGMRQDQKLDQKLQINDSAGILFEVELRVSPLCPTGQMGAHLIAHGEDVAAQTVYIAGLGKQFSAQGVEAML